MAKSDNRIISLIIIIILLWLLLSPEFMKFIKELTSSNNGSIAYIPGNKKDPLDTYDPRKRVLVDPNTLGRTKTEMG